MTWWDKFLGRVAAPLIETRVQEAVAQAREQLSMLSGRDPGPGFRRISEQPDRDLPSLTRDREVELAYYLYKTNILAGRMLELKRDFVVGDGFTVTSSDQAVQAAIDDFWQDPVNRFDLTLGQKVLELGLFGEQAYPVFLTPNMGRVRLGYLDPGQIDQIWPDPENAAILVGIETKGTGGKRKRYPIILSDEERTMLSPEAQRMRLSFTDAPCFFFSVNRVTNATRGSSDLLRKLDWLQAYEEFLFDRLEWFKQLGSFIWDVLLKGSDQTAINKWLENNPAPRSGSIRAHNEGVEWQAVAPDLKAVDLKEAARMFRNHILSDDGWPEHWFAEGGDVNRAVGAEMGDPIYRSITARQKLVQFMLHALVTFALRKRVEAGSLIRQVTITKAGESQTVPSWEAFTISAPEIASRDFARLGGVIVQIAQALLIARTNGWVSHDDAAKAFSLVASMFGAEIEPAPEEAQAQGPLANAQDFTPDQLGKMREMFGQIRQGGNGQTPEQATVQNA